MPVSAQGAPRGRPGPGWAKKKISGILPCTVISPGDMADEILDPKKHPEWEGERTKLMYTLPSAIKLWEQYAEIRADSFRRGSHGVDATEFYRQHQLDMDVGAAPAWPERFNPDEISAVQYAMNLRMLDERAFFAEYQNEPMIDD